MSDIIPARAATRKLAELHDSACTCDFCVGACQNRACWPTPSEAKALIDAGYSDRLMLDYWAGGDGPIEILAPAEIGHEGARAAAYPGGRCTFLNARNRCQLHRKGLKPSEGRKVDHRPYQGEPNVHGLVASTWQTKKAKALIARWSKGRDLSETPSESSIFDVFESIGRLI